MRLRSKEQGFTSLEFLAVFLIIGAMLGVSWSVINSQKKAEKSSQETPIQAQQTKNPAPNSESSLIEHKERVARVSLKYPKDWSLDTKAEPWVNGGFLTSTTTIKSPGGNSMSIEANYGGRGAMCDPLPTDVPFASGSQCPAYEILSKEKIALKSVDAFSRKLADDAYLLTGRVGVDNNMEYFIKVDTESNGPLKQNNPVMGAYSAKGSSLNVDNFTGNGTDDSMLYFDVVVTSSSKDFLSSKEAEQFKSIIRSFKNL